MVDADRIRRRLRLLDPLLPALEEAHSLGEDVYLEDTKERMAAERALQIVLQICIDVGAHLVSELGLGAPSRYRDIFTSLADGDVIPRDLADRLGRAAGMRNALVHGYDDLDDRQVFEALDHLDDLRAFAAAALEATEREGDMPPPG